MIKILIVDDNIDKISAIKRAIIEFPQISNDSITSSSDIISAKRNLSENQYDLMIIDMNLPDRFGDEARRDGGSDILSECKTNSSFFKPFHIIGITEYSDILEECSNLFADELWALIGYDSTSIEWKEKIKNKIKYLLMSKESMKRYHSTEYDYDIAIMTALHDPELTNVLLLDANWEKYQYPGDSTTYYIGVFCREDKRIKVVAASASQMGMTASSVLAMKMISNFKPKVLAMCGICAGLKDNSNLGDIVVCDLSWDYGTGKTVVDLEGKSKFLPDPKSIPIDTDVKEKILILKMERTYLDYIQSKWNGLKNSNRLNVIVGPLASGSAVIQDERIINDIISHNRKLVGVEMEAYGIFFASSNSMRPRPKALVIKSVCDYADSRKNDDYQHYAAYTSANYLYNISFDLFF